VLTGDGGGRGAGAREAAEAGHAEVTGAAGGGAGVDPGELALGAGEADPGSSGLAGPAVAYRSGGAGGAVAADPREAVPGDRGITVVHPDGRGAGRWPAGGGCGGPG
jgi:hypothetical protein